MFEDSDDGHDLPRPRPRPTAFQASRYPTRLIVGVVLLGLFGIGLVIELIHPFGLSLNRKTDADYASASTMYSCHQIAFAFRHYREDETSFPRDIPRDIADKNGVPLLSWRVAILPYLDEEALYRRFDLDQPWDGPTNLPLLGSMPQDFANNRRRGTTPGLTYFQAFVGPGTLFDPATPRRDLSRLPPATLLFIETATPIEWTKPGGIPYTPGGPLPPLGDGKSILATMANGSVQRLPGSIRPAELHQLIRVDGP